MEMRGVTEKEEFNDTFCELHRRKQNLSTRHGHRTIKHILEVEGEYP